MLNRLDLRSNNINSIDITPLLHLMVLLHLDIDDSVNLFILHVYYYSKYRKIAPTIKKLGNRV